jgi:hypothetical protein
MDAAASDIVAGDESRPLFILRNNGAEIRIYLDGRIDGLDGETIIVNNALPLFNAMHAAISANNSGA